MIFSLLFITNLELKELKKEKYFFYGLIMAVLINIKFTGFAFAEIYSLFYYIYIIVKKEQRKVNLIPITITSFVSVVVAVGLMGYSSYIKNTIEHQHPFYPLYGEKSVDIMTLNTPAGLNDLNRFKRFIIANFSYAYNGLSYGNPAYKLKIPLSFKVSEIENFKGYDTRVAGYGVLFGGILVITFCLGIFILFKIKSQKIEYMPYLIIIIASLFVIVLMKESWWARYFPQFAIIPLVVVVVALSFENIKYLKYLSNIIIVLFIMNNLLIINPQAEEIMKQKKVVDKQKNVIKNSPIATKILVATNVSGNEEPVFDGGAYNLYDIH